MKRILETITAFTWELLQTLCGAVVILFLGAKFVQWEGNRRIFFSAGMSGAVSLGRYIIVDKYYLNNYTVHRHEYGHTRQSLMLGPLYLFVIGIPSICWAGLYGTVIPSTHNGYYRFYTERWADKLGGVVRY